MATPKNEVIPYYKPPEISSFDVLRNLKRYHNITKNDKIGFAGTLDVMAEGLLLVGYGKGTKMLGELGDAVKEYHAYISFNGISDTGDREGHITRVKVPDDTADNIDVIDDFLGDQTQVPPTYSALHVKDSNGKSVRAYELAREGINVEMKPRKIHIYELEPIDINDMDMILRVKCSKGTYIRTLAHDIVSKMAGKSAGYLTKLVRTQVGDYTLDMCQSVPLVYNTL